MKNYWPFKLTNKDNSVPAASPKLCVEYLESCIVFSATPNGSIDKSNDFSGQDERVALLHQLSEEGFVQQDGDALLLPWDLLYQLLKIDDYQSSLPLLGLPPLELWRPRLKSDGGLTDSKFSILLEGWIDSNGKPWQQNAEINGGVLKCGQREILLSEESWRVTREVKKFHTRAQEERSADHNRLGWASIRRHALSANADLSDFLQKTVVITPDQLHIALRKTQFGESRTVEVIPGFEGQPDNWIGQFDSFKTVLDRYDVPDGAGGLVHVILSTEVQTVLREIKRMPGRRVAGDRAELFLRNPIATLGPDAANVIDPDQFDQAREAAGISYARFTVKVERDAGGIAVACALLVEESISGDVSSATLSFEGDVELNKFIEKLDAKIKQGAQCLFWEGYDLEILGDTPGQLDRLRSALRDLHMRQWISAAEVFDLSRYADGKIEGIGEEQPYYSAFIARKGDESSWFPDGTIGGISFTPKDGGVSVDLPLNKEGIEKFKDAYKIAKNSGKKEFNFPGCPEPISIDEAEEIIDTNEKAREDIEQHRPPIPRERKTRKGLILRPNIVQVDYEERRGILALPTGQKARLPASLKHGVSLKEHQIYGVAWLQHLWSLSPQECRGALLADDMGLGKTVQLLTFIAACLEDKPDEDPFLIVAPVSLLENWQEEMEKFFAPNTFPLLTLYGAQLVELRNKNINQDDDLNGIKLLRRSWLGDAKVVLTTYETLRDLEFTLAAQKWSVVICDEAQKIKNPNAMMTRAAKKQNVRFKIACTGTPVENSLADLWCLFDFIQPGLLGALNDFGSTYRKPIEAKTDEQKRRVEELRSIIEPQLLRRIKAEVAKDLPKKTIVDSCTNLPISKRQRNYYASAIAQHRTESGGLKNHLGLLLHLRRLCADPQPIGHFSSLQTSLEDVEDCSPKMKWLLTEMEKLRKDDKDKAIIFCELRDVQRLLQRAISERLNFVPAIINGDTSTNSGSKGSRQKQIRDFQEKKGFGVIILSPLAAGFGLNIQAANHVIHFTRTWNPAKEDQATDRAYRIGQNKEVFVYCPVIVADDFITFDAKLNKLLEWKRELSCDMLNGSGDCGAGDFGGLTDVDGGVILDDTLITAANLTNMMPDYFEVFCAVLWSKLGYYTTKCGGAGDGGVDVVAIDRDNGVLIQCKSSSCEGKAHGWDAIKDVVTGEAAYKVKYPGVKFKRIAITNQLFNKSAMDQAKFNNVELIDRNAINSMLDKYPMTLGDLIIPPTPSDNFL